MSDKQEILNKMKLANYRLRELEKADLTKSSNAYRYLDDLSNVGQDRGNELNGILRYDKSDRPRFSESKENYNLRDNWKQAEVEVDRFLNATTSTVSGTHEKYYNAYNSYKENNKTDVTFEQYAQYFQQFEGKNSLLNELPSDIIVLGLKNMTPDEVQNINDKYENAKNEKQEVDAINDFIKKAEQSKEDRGFFSKLKQKIGNYNFNRKLANQRKKAIKNLHREEKKRKGKGLFNRLFRK